MTIFRELKWIALVSLCFSILGCEEMDADDIEDVVDIGQESGVLPPGYKVIDGQLIYGGDIALGPAADYLDEDGNLLQTKAAGISDWSTIGTFKYMWAIGDITTTGPWPGGFIPYSVDPALSTQQKDNYIPSAVEHYRRNTTIWFYEVPVNYAGDHVAIVKGSGNCWAHLGKQDLPNGNTVRKVSLSGACVAAPVKHELGHSIGLLHEHQRGDRDNHVIVPATDDACVKHDFDQRYVTDYDVKSLMHYDDAGSGGCSGMTQIDGSEVPDFHEFLTASDINAIQAMYGSQFEATLAMPKVAAGVNRSARELGVFYRHSYNNGTASDLVHAYWNGSGWSNTRTPGIFIGTPAAVVDANGRARVYVRGTDGNLFRQDFDSNHQPDGNWQNMSAPSTLLPPLTFIVSGPPEAVAETDEVYVQATQRPIYQDGRYDSVSDESQRLFRWHAGQWQDLGGRAKQPAKAVRVGNKTHVFAIGLADFKLYHKYVDDNGNWTPNQFEWNTVPNGGFVTGRPSVVSCSDNTFEIVVKGPDAGAYYQAWSNGSWQYSTWQPLGGWVVGNPEIMCNGPYAFVYARSVDSNLYTKAGWSMYGGVPRTFFPNWSNVTSQYPIQFIGTPAIAAGSTDRGVFVRGQNDKVWYNNYIPNASWDQVSTLEASW
ncbi:MAG: hypothetical protein GY847_09805 [Proteobacteria bacterium]|nr:hypothetical protein [Pseudomonadota bacterium]